MGRIRNEDGQFVMEAVLLIFVLVAIFMGSMKFLKDEGYLQGLIADPLESVAGMIESGVWVSRANGGGQILQRARSQHPNQTNRGASSRGDGDL